MRNQKAPQTAREWLTSYRDRQILVGREKDAVSQVEFDALAVELAQDSGVNLGMARHWVGLGYVVAGQVAA